MGCVGSSPTDEGGTGDNCLKKFTKPKAFAQTPPVTRRQLERMRYEFWDTQPAYGGQKEIWDALKAAADNSDVAMGHLILESAGVVHCNADMTICYDERGAKYDIPKYCLVEPNNLLPDGAEPAPPPLPAGYSNPPAPGAPPGPSPPPPASPPRPQPLQVQAPPNGSSPGKPAGAESSKV